MESPFRLARSIYSSLMLCFVRHTSAMCMLAVGFDYCGTISYIFFFFIIPSYSAYVCNVYLTLIILGKSLTNNILS